jgi:hypothetical protein
MDLLEPGTRGLHRERTVPKRPDNEPVMYSWDEATSALVDWFLTTDLPREPFRLRSGVEVTKPGNFYNSLKNDIEQGVEGARARTGALQEDLEDLFDLFGNEEGPGNP